MRIGLLVSPAAAEPGAPPDDAGGALAAALASLRAHAVALGGGEARIPRCDAVIVAGGPIGDDAPALRALASFAAAGRPVLGIGDGFRTLCRLGLLPGALDQGAPTVAVAGAVHLRVEGRPTPFTS